MKKILMICAFAPASTTAGQAFTLRLLNDISRDHHVDLCFFYASPSPPIITITNVTVLFSEQLTLGRRIIGALSLPFMHPLFTSRFSFRKAFKLRSIADRYDAVYFDFSQIFIYALFIKHRNKIAMAHDIVTQMYERRPGKLAWLHTMVCRLTENMLIKGLNAKLFCFSEKDCRLVNSNFGVSAEKVDFYLDERIYETTSSEIYQHNKFVFYGAWGRRENSSGLLWFITNVFPLLGSHCQFTVIGSGVSEEVLKASQAFGESIEFAGFVENPYELLAEAKALVAPLFEGAGVKVKVLESLACGTSVIGTNVSFEGIAPELLVHCRCCNSAAEFADVLNSYTRPDRHLVQESFLKIYPSKTMGTAIRTSCAGSELDRKIE